MRYMILFCLLIVVLEEVASSPLASKIVVFKLKEKRKVVEKLKCIKKAAPAPAPPVYPSYTKAPPAPPTTTPAATTTPAPTTTTPAPTTTTPAPTTTTPAPTPSYYG